MNPVATFLVSLDGSPLPDQIAALMVSAHVDDSLNVPDMFELTFADPDRTFLQSSGIAMGMKVTIEVVSDAAPGGEQLLAGAEITALEAALGREGSFTIVRGFDQAHRLFNGRRTESYRNMSYSDIAQKVASRAGLATGRIQPTSPVFPFVPQGNVSDWELLSGFAREVGFEVAVVDGKLDFRKPAESSGGPGSGTLRARDPLKLTLGDNLLEFRAAVTAAQQVKEVKVRSWDPSAKRPIIGTAPAKTASASVKEKPETLAARFGNPVFEAVSVPFSTQAEADAAAKALAEELGSTFATFEGVALGNVKLKPGQPVSLGLVGDPFDGKYTLTSTRHVFTPEEGYVTLFTVSGRHDRSLLALASGGGSPDHRVLGVVPGIVTNVRDPDDLFRVKVKFPWLSDTFETDWCRTLQAWAGNGYGAVVLPEVNDEVLVAFEQGDLRRPYVVGGLYNGGDKGDPGTTIPLVDSGTGKVNKRKLVSRKGHSINFLDKDGNEGINIRSGDHKCMIDLNSTKSEIVVQSDGTVVVKAKRDVTIEAQGNLDISAQKITIKAKSGVQVDAGAGNVDVKGVQVAVDGQAKVAVQGATVSVNGQGMAEVKSGGVLTVQGTLVKIN